MRGSILLPNIHQIKQRSLQLILQLHYYICAVINQIQIMDPSLFHLNNSSDDTLDILKEFLPQIQHQLRQQVQPILIQQFTQKTSQQLQEIQNQAQAEYNQALQTLQSEFMQLKAQKERQISEQLAQLEQKLNEQEYKRTVVAQQRCLQQNFDTRILSHPKLQQISQELQNQLGQALLQQYHQFRQRKVKELRIRLQSREQRERKEIDKSIHAQIYSKSGLEELRGEVKNFRISLASLKSKYNLKINGVNKDTQELIKKCKEIQYPNSEYIIQQLNTQISQLKAKQRNQDESSINSDKNSYFEQNSHRVHQQPTSFNQQFTNYPETQFIHEDIDLDSQSYVDQSQKQRDQQESDIPMPPNHKNMLEHLLSTQQETYSSPSQEQIYLEMPKQPLLKFNIAKMMRDQWQEDDLDRYLSAQLQKQNKNSNLPEPTSNFSTLYQQHLDRLNHHPKPKMRKLSQKAKQTLLLNLSSQRQKRQQSFYNC